LELSEFDSFRAELRALIVIIQGIQKSTLHDESLRERFRTLFRTWTSTVEPLLATYHDGRREILKLHAEIEKLAQLASKRKPIADYKKYLRRACQLFRQYRNQCRPVANRRKHPLALAKNYSHQEYRISPSHLCRIPLSGGAVAWKVF